MLCLVQPITDLQDFPNQQSVHTKSSRTAVRAASEKLFLRSEALVAPPMLRAIHKRIISPIRGLTLFLSVGLAVACCRCSCRLRPAAAASSAPLPPSARTTFTTRPWPRQRQPGSRTVIPSGNLQISYFYRITDIEIGYIHINMIRKIGGQTRNFYFPFYMLQFAAVFHTDRLTDKT